jgi:hypothetical protein
MKSSQIVLNVGICILCCVFGIIDNINAIEFYMNATFYSPSIKLMVLVFLISHPVVLFFYYLISLLYLSYISDHEFNELTSNYEYYEMVYFRNFAQYSTIWVLPLTLYLVVLTYLKFFSFYSLKFLIEEPSNFVIFRNVVTTTLYASMLIQVIFQSFPQLILQSMNNLLIMEDKHDFHMRGVFNFSAFFSICLIMMLFVLYLREKKFANKPALKSEDVNLII